MGIRKSILEIMETTGENLVKEIQSSFQKQGHGKGDSVEQLTYESGGNVNTDINMPDYYEIVNRGVKPNKIPYGKKTGQKRSKYIEGLIKFFKSKGFDEKGAKSFAFNTAKKQKQEGLSTIASKRFSETGQRQKFLESATDASKEFEKVDIKVLDVMENEMNLVLDELQSLIS
jgi:hypothetical protein